MGFTLMAGAIVVLVLAAGKMPGPGREQNTPAEDGASLGSAGMGSGLSPGASAARHQSQASAGRRLASALAAALPHRTGTIAVGVVTTSPRAEAEYDGTRSLPACGAARLDILAALLLQHQRAGTLLSTRERQLTVDMVDADDAGATSALWNTVGQESGVRQANRLLGLRQTTPGRGSNWALTTTTADDQLRLLTDLTSGTGPLSGSSRSYALSLMRRMPGGHAAGSAAAAGPGTVSLADIGWLRDGSAQWAVASIGEITRNGRQFLVAVLSDGQPSAAAGLQQAAKAEQAAISAITSG